MAIYHLDAKVISRSSGRSACAAAAYMSCSQIFNHYDGIQHDYTKKRGLIWQKIFLPEYAPQEWLKREVLWNAVEEGEKNKNSRLAREFVVALPIELDKSDWQALLTDFIQNNFIADGMCADVAIHNTDGHNPHAHIMLTVRPLDKSGKWQYKTEKEYVCIKDGIEKSFTASEFKIAQANGWEKQYPYKMNKKKVYLPPSVAELQGLERVSKYPKSTKYGRQNPISERWNSDEQLVIWRKNWADVTNLYLERAGQHLQIDHRSHAARGLKEQPTIHEGVTARALEKQGVLSERCEMNRQIKADNKLLQELKQQAQKLVNTIKNSIPSIAAVLESLREHMILLQYQIINNTLQRDILSFRHTMESKALTEYQKTNATLKEKVYKKKILVSKKKSCNLLQFIRSKKLNEQITTLTEEIEELKSKKAQIFVQLGCKDGDITNTAKLLDELKQNLEKLEIQYTALTSEKEKSKEQFIKIRSNIAPDDMRAVKAERSKIRPKYRKKLFEHLQKIYTQGYQHSTVREANEIIDTELNEHPIHEPLHSLSKQLHPSKYQQKQSSKHKDYER